MKRIQGLRTFHSLALLCLQCDDRRALPSLDQGEGERWVGLGRLYHCLPGVPLDNGMLFQELSAFDCFSHLSLQMRISHALWLTAPSSIEVSSTHWRIWEIRNEMTSHSTLGVVHKESSAELTLLT